MNNTWLQAEECKGHNIATKNKSLVIWSGLGWTAWSEPPTPSWEGSSTVNYLSAHLVTPKPNVFYLESVACSLESRIAFPISYITDLRQTKPGWTGRRITEGKMKRRNWCLGTWTTGQRWQDECNLPRLCDDTVVITVCNLDLNMTQTYGDNENRTSSRSITFYLHSWLNNHERLADNPVWYVCLIFLFDDFSLE